MERRPHCSLRFKATIVVPASDQYEALLTLHDMYRGCQEQYLIHVWYYKIVVNEGVLNSCETVYLINSVSV